MKKGEKNNNRRVVINDQNDTKENKKNENNYTVVIEPPKEEDEFLLTNNDDIPEVDDDPIINREEFTREQAKREELENVKIRKTQANTFEKYIQDTGVSAAFQLIFQEIIIKKIPVEDHFSYAAGRLRHIQREVEEIKLKNK